MKQDRIYNRKKMRMLLAAGVCMLFVFFCVCLGGCGINELENQAFPLALGVEKADKGCRLYLAYPNLQDEKASENALSTDVYWNGEVPDLTVGMQLMSEKSNKNPDLNHLKVLILQPEIFSERETVESVLAFFEQETDAAWNTYVLMTEEPMQELFSEENQLPECMGMYLEDMLEEWEYVKKSAFVTVGTLMRQIYGTSGTVCIPKIVREQGRISIGGFVVLNQLQVAGNLSLEDGQKALLLQNKLREYQFQMQDGTGVTLQQLKVTRQVTGESNAAGSMRPMITITVRGQTGWTNRMKESDHSSTRELQAQEELQNQLQQLAESWQQTGCDLTDSYALLAGKDRKLWKLYQDEQERYSADLNYAIWVKNI